jgi:hypothetical protein
MKEIARYISILTAFSSSIDLLHTPIDETLKRTQWFGACILITNDSWKETAHSLSSLNFKRLTPVKIEADDAARIEYPYINVAKTVRKTNASEHYYVPKKSIYIPGINDLALIHDNGKEKVIGSKTTFQEPDDLLQNIKIPRKVIDLPDNPGGEIIKKAEQIIENGARTAGRNSLPIESKVADNNRGTNKYLHNNGRLNNNKLLILQRITNIKQPYNLGNDPVRNYGASIGMRRGDEHPLNTNVQLLNPVGHWLKPPPINNNELQRLIGLPHSSDNQLNNFGNIAVDIKNANDQALISTWDSKNYTAKGQPHIVPVTNTYKLPSRELYSTDKTARILLNVEEMSLPETIERAPHHIAEAGRLSRRSREEPRRAPYGGNYRGIYTINVNKPLIETLTINAKDGKDTLNNFKQKVEEALLEILNSANAIQ